MTRLILLCTLSLVLAARNSRLEGYIAALGGQSFLETHVESTLASKSQHKTRLVDLDCDSTTADSDQIENSCHEYRYRLLVTLAPVVQDLINNQSALISQLNDLNVTTNGTALEDGLFQKIAFQSMALYAGNVSAKVPALEDQGARVLPDHVFDMFNIINGMYDTEWSNLLTTADTLGEYITDFNIGAFVDQLKMGMNNAQFSQADMSDVFAQRTANTLLQGNNWLASSTKMVNDFQAQFSPAMTALSATADKNNQNQIASSQAASDQLDSTTDYLDTAPQTYSDALDQYKAGIIAAVKAGDATFLSNATTAVGPITTNWQRQQAMFEAAAQASLDQESKAWGQAETARVGNFVAAFKTFTQKNNDALADTQLSDSQDMGTMNDLVNNMTDTADGFIYQAQNSVTQSSTQLKQLQARATSANVDVGAEFTKLLTSLSDGTGDQQTKISNFLKLSADSDASQLAALVQSASAMRDSLGTGQAGTRADLDNLIASLQTKLAQKAQNEGNVSMDVQNALAVGSDTDQAKIAASKDYQSLLNSQTFDGMNDAAGGALDSVTEATMAGVTSISDVAGDMRSAASGSTQAVSDQATLTGAQTQQAIAVLYNLATSQTGSALKSTSDASLAAHDILTSLAGVKSGSTSLAAALADRSGSTASKLSAIANQLGMSDDAVSKMYGGLLTSIGRSADSQIQTTLSAQLGSSKSVASKLSSNIDQSNSDLDGATSDAETAQQHAVDVNAKFKANIAGVAQSLDAQFASQADRDNAVRSAVSDGLAATNAKLVISATQAVNSVSNSRQSYSDATSLQVDKDIASFESDVSHLSQSEFNKVQALMTQVAAAAATRQSSTTDLAAATNGFYSYIVEANRRIGVESSQLDNDEKFFGANTSAIWAGGSPELANLTQIDGFKTDLVNFMKTVPQKVSDGIKAIEDAFLMTDSQIAAKAQMLQAMAKGQISDSQRAAINSQLDNLKQSETLMANFKEVQRQALNQVFAKNSGLLGAAGGTVGNLTDVANSISTMLNSNSQLNAQIDNTFSATSGGANTMSSQMATAVSGTQDALSRSIATASSQNAFSSNITNAQVGALVQSGGRDGDLANAVASDVANVSDQSILEKQQQLAAYAQMLSQNHDDLATQATNVLRTANNSDAGLQQQVQNDSAEKATQLIIVKNAVEQLLQTWYQYTQAENRKFTRWNATEDEYLGQYTGSLASLNQSAMTQVTKTSQSLTEDQQLSANAIRDLMSFENQMRSSRHQIHDAVRALNISSNSSIAQVGEQIYQQDLMDSTYDADARQTAQRDVVIASNTADAQMLDIVNSLHAPSSFMEIYDDEDSLQQEAERLDAQLDKLDKV